ncbi:hypothetical protein CsSME_00008560 [Camellia sinensis var. sinensis]
MITKQDKGVSRCLAQVYNEVRVARKCNSKVNENNKSAEVVRRWTSKRSEKNRKEIKRINIKVKWQDQYEG